MASNPSNTQIKEFQDLMNKFTTKYLRGVKPIPEDGVSGPMTRIRAETCKWYIGFGKTRHAPDGELTTKFLSALKSPKGKFIDRRVRAAGASRRTRQRAARRAGNGVARAMPGVGIFDGKPVAKCMIPQLKWARNVGHRGKRWHGYLNSGWRSIPYSISLCFRICGAPRCPGRCAGSSTRHVGKTCSSFAGDVSDYKTFGELMPYSPHNPKIHNSLGAQDPVHFSPQGN